MPELSYPDLVRRLVDLTQLAEPPLAGRATRPVRAEPPTPPQRYQWTP